MKSFLPVLLCLFLCSSSFSQIKLDSGLVAYYPFNGNANDESGNGNNPAFNNATLTDDYLGKANSAYHFNGSNTYMMVPNSVSLNMNKEVSIALRVRPMDFYTGPCYNNMLIMKGDADYLPGTYFLRFSDVPTGCSATPTTTNEQFYGTGVVATNPAVKLNQWYNVTWTYDGVTARIYVDCNLMNSKDSALSPFITNFNLYIGRLNNEQYPYWLNGDLDDIRIYNRALNEEEIKALCASSGPLPISLSKFDANATNKQIALNWKVENESGIRDYVVERSLTGHSDFVKLGTILAKNNHSYTFIDNAADVNQAYYYRLVIEENDGAINYSEIKTAKIAGKNKLVVVYPNPSRGSIAVKINSYTGNAKFTITNSVGQVTFQKNQLITNSTPVSFKVGNRAGIYWLKVATNKEEFVERIVVF